MLINQFKPGVAQRWLIALAGVVWSCVGSVMCVMAGLWLSATTRIEAVPLASAGIGMAWLVHRFGFSRIAQKNIQRLRSLGDNTCIFAFQAWRSYILVLVMVTLGVMLRHSFIPSHYLAAIYLTVGGALFFASFNYYAELWTSAHGSSES